MKLWKDLFAPLMPILGSVIGGPAGGAIGGAIGGIGQKGNTFQNMLSGGLQGGLGGFGGGWGNILNMFGGGGSPFGNSASWMRGFEPGRFNTSMSPLNGFFGNSGSGSMSSLMDNFNLPSISKTRGIGSFNSLFGSGGKFSDWDSNVSRNSNLKFR